LRDLRLDMGNRNLSAIASAIKVVRDYLAMQDPVAELLTVYGFGRRRSARIADVLQGFVDDFLS
jgi:hypothetical protein